MLVPSARSAATSEQTRGGSEEQGPARIAQDEPAVTVPEPPPAAEGGGGGGGNPSAAATPAEPPRVVFGNGRTPGPSTNRPEAPTLVTARVPELAAETPVPATLPAPSAPNAGEPTLFQRSMAPLLMPTAPAASITSLWGLAGLILAPLAGILLGYRQARANKAAAELKSTLSR